MSNEVENTGKILIYQNERETQELMSSLSQTPFG